MERKCAYGSTVRLKPARHYADLNSLTEGAEPAIKAFHTTTTDGPGPITAHGLLGPTSCGPPQ